MPDTDQTPRTWDEPATVVIHQALMPAFEAWLSSRDLLLMGPARTSEDPEDLAGTVGPRREHLFAEQPDAPYDRSARIRALGISEEQEKEIRQRGAAQNLAIKADDEERLARLRAAEDYTGE